MPGVKRVWVLCAFPVLLSTFVRGAAALVRVPLGPIASSAATRL